MTCRADCYALYTNDVDVSAAKAEEDVVLSQLADLQKKFAPRSEDLANVLAALDAGKSGSLSMSDLKAGCASLGLVLGEKELLALSSYTVPSAPGGHGGAVLNEAGDVIYANFIAMLTTNTGGLTKRARDAGKTTKAPSRLTVPSTLAKSGVNSPASPAPKRVHA